MPCPYLTAENNCTAKPYGDEGHIPDQKILVNYFNNDITMYDCRRAIIYDAYLKSDGK